MLFLSRLPAQTVVSELPVHFGQYFNNPQINPAKGGSEAAVELYAASRRNSENWGGVSTSAFSSYFRLKTKSESFNTLGLDLNTDKEGPVLSRNRAYGSFSRHQKLNETWFLAGGISAGIYNFGIKSSDQFAGASAIAFDGNSGIWLCTKATKLGLSVLQFNNAKVRPFEQAIQLTRHYYFTGEQNLHVNEFFQLTPSVFARYVERNLNPFIQTWSLGGVFNVLLNDIVSFGTSYEKQEGFYAFIGIQNVCMACGENKKNDLNALSIDISFFMPNRNNYRTNTHAFEIVLRYNYTGTKVAPRT